MFENSFTSRERQIEFAVEHIKLGYFVKLVECMTAEKPYIVQFSRKACSFCEECGKHWEETSNATRT